MVEMMKRVAIYARVSTDKQTTAQQIAELRAAAQRHGWQIVGEYVDHGISGSKGRDQRPKLDAMLKAVTRREFDVIAAWSVDRLGRSLQHLGRPRVAVAVEDRVRVLRCKGRGIISIAKAVGVGTGTVQRIVAA